MQLVTGCNHVPRETCPLAAADETEQLDSTLEKLRSRAVSEIRTERIRQTQLDPLSFIVMREKLMKDEIN